MDPLQASTSVNINEEGTQDIVLYLDGNLYETQVELSLIS